MECQTYKQIPTGSIEGCSVLIRIEIVPAIEAGKDCSHTIFTGEILGEACNVQEFILDSKFDEVEKGDDILLVGPGILDLFENVVNIDRGG